MFTPQGEVVKVLKTDKAPEPAVKEAVALLLKLKGEHKALTGEDFPAGGGKKSKKDKKAKQAPVPKADKRAGAAADPNQPAITKLDIRVGKIVKVWTHETADKVLIFVHLARSDV
jgi:tRNA-binding EMAP/Myf-like protein